jgi:hypothetical protein
LADEFKSQLATPLMAMHIGTYVAIGLGSLLILVAISIIAWKKIFGDVSINVLYSKLYNAFKLL